MSKVIETQALAFSIEDVIAMTARLAQILAQEVDLLDEMKISGLALLQDEKQRLTLALEKQKEAVRKHPELLDGVTDSDREELSRVAQLFNTVLGENHRRLLTAKEVNNRIVQAITDVVNDHSGNKVYNTHGAMAAPRPTSFSVTINQTI